MYIILRILSKKNIDSKFLEVVQGLFCFLQLRVFELSMLLVYNIDTSLYSYTLYDLHCGSHSRLDILGPGKNPKLKIKKTQIGRKMTFLFVDMHQSSILHTQKKEGFSSYLIRTYLISSIPQKIPLRIIKFPANSLVHKMGEIMFGFNTSTI